MSSKYGFKTRREKEVEKRQQQEEREKESRRLRELRRMEKQEGLAVKERGRRHMLEIATGDYSFVRDVLDDYRKANEIPGKVIGPIVEIEKRRVWRQYYGYTDKWKIVPFAYWQFGHAIKVDVKFYRVRIELIFDNHCNPEYFAIDGIRGENFWGKTGVAPSKEALIRTLLCSEPEELFVWHEPPREMSC